MAENCLMCAFPAGRDPSGLGTQNVIIGLTGCVARLVVVRWFERAPNLISSFLTGEVLFKRGSWGLVR